MPRFLLACMTAALLLFTAHFAWAEDKTTDNKISEPAKQDAPKTDAAKTETKTDPAAPDTSKITFIENLRHIGATVYYMGEAMGLNSWLIVKGKQIQILYTTPDQRAVVVGALLSAEGANISQQQILMLAERHPEVAAVLREGQGATVKVADANNTSSGAGPPSEALYTELSRATRVTFGKSGAPIVFMVMDVYCHFCQETWKLLEPYVDSGRIQLAMIPIAALGAQSEVDAANWLNKKDPLDAWRKHIAGDDTLLKTGTPDPDKEKKIAENTQLITKWNIDRTPYLFYRGKNGKVRVVVGEPKDVNALLNDLQ